MYNKYKYNKYNKYNKYKYIYIYIYKESRRLISEYDVLVEQTRVRVLARVCEAMLKWV